MSDAGGRACPSCQADFLDNQAPSFCPHCRFPLLLLAGKYRLERVLGRGTFGTIYLARHINLEQGAERVIKVLKPELLSKPSISPRFFREIQLTAVLSQKSHHIVRIYD